MGGRPPVPTCLVNWSPLEQRAADSAQGQAGRGGAKESRHAEQRACGERGGGMQGKATE